MKAPIDSASRACTRLDALLSLLSGARAPLDSVALTKALGDPVSLHNIAPWVSFDPNVYARNRVQLFPHAEVLVMCWRPGQLTPIHNHAGSACAVQVIAGIATEITYRQSNSNVLFPTSSAHFASGAVLSSFDEDVHQMGNLEGSGSDLVTLHVYSPPLHGMTIFEQSQTFFAGYEDLFNNVSRRVSQARALQGQNAAHLSLGRP